MLQAAKSGQVILLSNAERRSPLVDASLTGHRLSMPFSRRGRYVYGPLIAQMELKPIYRAHLLPITGRCDANGPRAASWNVNAKRVLTDSRNRALLFRKNSAHVPTRMLRSRVNAIEKKYKGKPIYVDISRIDLTNQLIVRSVYRLSDCPECGRLRDIAL